MIKKKYYLFFLSIFMQLVSMQNSPDNTKALVSLPIDIYRIIGAYLDDASVGNWACTCTQLQMTSFVTSNGFIKTSFPFCTQLLSRIADGIVQITENKDLKSVLTEQNVAPSLRSPFADLVVSVEQNNSDDKNTFQRIYSLHANERNAGIRDAFGIKDPCIEDCIKFYSKKYYEVQKEWGDVTGRRFHTLNLLIRFAEDKNFTAISTVLLASQLIDFINLSGKCYGQILFEHCFLNNGDIIIHIMRNILDKTKRNKLFSDFVRYVMESKQTALLDYVCDHLYSANAVLHLLIRTNMEHRFNWQGHSLFLGDRKYTKQFIKRKDINLNAPDCNGKSVLDYVWDTDYKVTYGEAKRIVLKMLIDDYADPNYIGPDGKTLLQRHCLSASSWGIDARGYTVPQLRLSSLLLNHNTIIKNVNKIIDRCGNTALHYYVHSGDYNAIKKLLLAGADVNSRNNDGDTPLFLLLAAGNDILDGYHILQAIELLLQYGAQVNVINKKGYSLWHLVCLKYKRALEQCFENCRAQDYEKHTFSRSQDRASVSKQYLDLMKILIDAGVDIDIVDLESKQVAHHDIDNFLKREWNQLIVDCHESSSLWLPEFDIEKKIANYKRWYNGKRLLKYSTPVVLCGLVAYAVTKSWFGE